ncbi:MAG: TetR family transcriptional regulator [Stackebrandtia sp.]
METRRSGRRPGSPDTRAEILAAAREAFAAHGFVRSSIRRIAADAGVDPALVHHYFGTKKKLFLAAIEAPFDPTEIIEPIVAGGIDGLGERLVRTFVTVWDGPIGTRAVAFIRSAISDPEVAPLVEEFIMTQIIGSALAETAIGLDHLERRGSLVASQLMGMALARYILKLPPLVGLPPEDMAKLYGPTIQRYITLDIEGLGLSVDR